MDARQVGQDMGRVLHSLSRITLEAKERDEALKKITALGRRVLAARACVLALVDVEARRLKVVACDGLEVAECPLLDRWTRPGTAAGGGGLDFDLITRGEVVERTNLQTDGQGVVDPRLARQYGLKSLLGHPLKLDARLVGYFLCFFPADEPQPRGQRNLAEVFAAHAALTIERFERYQTFESLRSLNVISQSILSVYPQGVLRQAAQNACELLGTPVCIVWELDESRGAFKVAATVGDVDEEFKSIELGLDRPDIRRFLERKKPAYLRDVTEPGAPYLHRREARERGWKTILSAPLNVGGQPVGLLDIYTTQPRYFRLWERELFAALANQVALSIQKDQHEKRRLEAGRDRVVAEIQEALNKVVSFRRATLEADSRDTLNLIARKCAEAASARVCALRLLSGVTDELELKAFYARTASAAAPSIGHRIRIGEGIAGHVASVGRSYVRDDVEAEPGRGKFYKSIGVKSVLCVPIKSDGSVIGTISVGDDRVAAFGAGEQQLLETVVDSVSNAIEKANLMDSLSQLEQAASQATSLEAFLKQLVGLTSVLMREAICVIWLLDRSRNGFVVKEFSVPDGQADKISGLFISLETRGLDEFLRGARPLYFRDARDVPTHPYLEDLKALGWTSMLAAPLVFQGRAKGILEVYSRGKERVFTQWQRRQFKTLAAQATLAIETLKNPNSFDKLRAVYQEITESEPDKIWAVLLERCLELVGSSRGWVSQLNYRTGRFEVKAQRGGAPAGPLDAGQGVCGLALKREEPIRVGDVRQGPLARVYQEYWPDTRSELAVPILVSNARARVGRRTAHVTKPIGVINIESPTAGAFTGADQDVLWSLARHAAIIIEKLELDAKADGLQSGIAQMLSTRDWDETMRVVLRAVTETLGFEYVNISLVDEATNQIKTEYVVGIPEEDVAAFKKRSAAALGSKDIRAETVRSREIEVPNQSDGRFDSYLNQRFRLGDLIRVYLPMISSSGEKVLGAVEAGYRRGHRKHIYEQDVRVLKGFVDRAVLALEQQRRGLLDRILHEFSAPIAGIRNTASFFSRRYGELSEKQHLDLLEEIQMDCDILMYQFDELEQFLGRRQIPLKREWVVVYTDIIIKMVNKFRLVVAERGLDASRINYRFDNHEKFKIRADRARLSSVIYNLLMNSIKYAERSPDSFRIEIGAESTPENLVIKFRDWGIGIKEGTEELIFEEGFRAPEAKERFVSGSGLGLAIARKAMREMGGDLILAGLCKPTEFQALLPRSLKGRVP